MDGKEREQCSVGEQGWSAKKEKTGEERRHMERHKTERTDERMEPNERRRSIGLGDEREGEATSSSPSPLLVPFLTRENECVSIFFLIRSAALSLPHKGGTYLARGDGKELAEVYARVCARACACEEKDTGSPAWQGRMPVGGRPV